LNDADAGDARVLNRVLRNVGILLGGRAFGGVLALLATLLSARALGPAAFGTVVTIHAYLLVVRGLVNIKPFEAIIRYGVPLHDDGDYAGLGRLLRMALAFDVGTALVGALVAWLAAPLVGPWLGWEPATSRIAACYGLILLASGIATASGVLRMFDRYADIGTALVVANAVRLTGVLIALWLEARTIAAFALVWGLSQVVQYVLTLAFGWRVARARLPLEHLAGPVAIRGMGRAHPGMWRFLNVVYWQSSLDLVPKSLGTLLTANLLGTDAAAMFRIAREFANVVSKPALLVRQAIYPDLTRLRHRGDPAFTRLIIRIGALLGGPALAFALLSLWLGAPLLALTVGLDYLPAAPLLSWLIAAAALELASAPLRPAAYALGVAGAVLRVQVLACAVFIAVLQWSTPLLGLNGPGVATTALMAVTLVGLTLSIRRAL
jgi:O-antigen/teichoic acid export membrane protein